MATVQIQFRLIVLGVKPSGRSTVAVHLPGCGAPGNGIVLNKTALNCFNWDDFAYTLTKE